MRRRLTLVLVSVATLAFPGVGYAQQLSQAEVMQLLTAAGMSVNGRKVLNPCHRPTAPQVKFIDMNGDGRAEAVTLDHDPACYGPDPGYQTKLLAKDAAGRWQVIAVLLGVFKPLETRSYGWRDFTTDTGSCRPVFRSNGRAYTALPVNCGTDKAPQDAGPGQAVAGVPGPSDQLSLFPATYGRFAPGGDCARLPRVTVSAQSIQLETATGNASFTHPNVVTNFMGPQDESISYQLQGPGEGLQIVIDGKTLTSAGGDNLGAAERAVDAVADPNRTPLQRCGS